MAEFDEKSFMLSFGFLYKIVKKFSAYEERLSSSDLIQQGGKTGKLIGEFLAADGVSEIDFSPLKETISSVDRFLELQALNDQGADALSKKLQDQLHVFKQPLRDMMEARKIDTNLEGAPLIMLTFGYADMLLKGIRSVADISDRPTMQNRINLLKLQIQDNPPAIGLA